MGGVGTRQHRREVADAAVHLAEEPDDCFLVCGDAVEIAHVSDPRPARSPSAVAAVRPALTYCRRTARQRCRRCIHAGLAMAGRDGSRRPSRCPRRPGTPPWPSYVIPHLPEHLFHVGEPQLFVSRALKRDQRVQLARCDLVLFKLILGLEECPHVPDERLCYARRQLNVLGHNSKDMGLTPKNANPCHETPHCWHLWHLRGTASDVDASLAAARPAIAPRPRGSGFCVHFVEPSGLLTVRESVPTIPLGSACS
jgi:hypothetical protein